MIISLITIIPAAIVLTLASFFALEIFGALLPRRQLPCQRPQRIAVIIPAHNESSGIIPTLADIRAQLEEADRLIVVADNCTDNTADVVRAAGVDCIERNDSNLRGKGYAQQAGLSALQASPPDVVYFLDADCRLGEGTLGRVAGVAYASNRPAQGLTLMQAPTNAPPHSRVAEFAWLVMNRIRMGGLFRIFDVARLTGTGMALPWKLAGELDMARAEIVEDLSFSLTLTRRGFAPVFVVDAISRSVFPVSDDAIMKQRARWEHGSLQMTRRNIFPLLFEGAVRGNIRLLALALDMAIPPLVLFAFVLVILAVGTLLLIPFGIFIPFWLSVSANLLFGLFISVAWLKWGRSVLPLNAAGEIIQYILFKRKIYGDTARQSTKVWTRTERSKSPLPDREE